MEPASLFALTAAAGIGLHKATSPSSDETTNDSEVTGDNATELSVNQSPTTQFVNGKIVFPVPTFQGVKPTRSQEYRKTDHHGCDLMYPRDGVHDKNYPGSTSNGSKMFFMPEDVYALAAAPGSIWATGVGPTGIYVVLDHGKPFATFYVHLDLLDTEIPMNIQRGQGKIQVRAGQRLGRIGFSPRDGQKLKHLHFEVWNGGASESHVDPWPFINGAPVLGVPNNKAAIGRSLFSSVDIQRIAVIDDADKEA